MLTSVACYLGNGTGTGHGGPAAPRFTPRHRSFLTEMVAFSHPRTGQYQRWKKSISAPVACLLYIASKRGEKNEERNAGLSWSLVISQFTPFASSSYRPKYVSTEEREAVLLRHGELQRITGLHRLLDITGLDEAVQALDMHMCFPMRKLGSAPECSRLQVPTVNTLITSAYRQMRS